MTEVSCKIVLKYIGKMVTGPEMGNAAAAELDYLPEIEATAVRSI